LNIEARLKDYVSQRVEGLDVASYAVAVVSGDEMAFTAGGSLSSGEPGAVTTDTPFHICSCSKAFTALACSSLVKDGLTGWDEPAAVIIPELQLPDAQITARYTLRDLAGMRIGLERDGIAEWGFRPDAPVELRLSRARAMRLTAPFRDRFSYSNLSYIGLACALSRIAHTSFAECLRHYVFGPLGLHTASLEASGLTAQPHMPEGSGMSRVPELTAANSQGSARVHLSARDAAHWLAFNLSLCAEGAHSAAVELFSPQSVIRPTPAPTDGTPTPYAYGLGWQLAQLEGSRILQHSGGGRGWRSMAMIDASRHRAVMVMLAHEDVAAEALALEILELLDHRTPAPRITLLAERADREARNRNEAQRLRRDPGAARPDPLLTGRYANAVTGSVDISQGEHGELRFAASDAPAFDATLEPRPDGIHTFRFDSPAMRTMPRDPPFEARPTVKDDRIVLETTYFGWLEQVK